MAECQAIFHEMRPSASNTFEFDLSSELGSRFAGGREILIQIKVLGTSPPQNFSMQWTPIANAPFDCDLELAVLDEDGAHALAFACRRVAGGWANAQTKNQIEVRPTHWREWAAKR